MKEKYVKLISTVGIVFLVLSNSAKTSGVGSSGHSSSIGWTARRRRANQLLEIRYGLHQALFNLVLHSGDSFACLRVRVGEFERRSQRLYALGVNAFDVYRIERFRHVAKIRRVRVRHRRLHCVCDRCHCWCCR